jgi:RecB family exonuclease
MDGKKMRSRFVEEAIWRVEQRQGHRLETGEGPLAAAVFPMTEPPIPVRRAIPRTQAVNESMDAILDKPLSPTRLDEYLSCPARFFHRHVCSLYELDEVPEGDDYPAVGTMLHKVLHRTFEPYLGKFLRPGDISAERLAALFREELDASGLCDSLPAQSRFMLEAAGPHRLTEFLGHQPELTEVLQLENDTSAELLLGDRRFVLAGQIDRLDRREQGLVILDYKSGRTSKSPRREFWHDEDLWQAMRDWTPGMPDPLAELADSLPSLQLPCYLYMCGHDPKNAEYLRLSPLADAAWVQLADGGEEVSLMGRSVEEEERGSIIAERIPELLSFVLRHMAEAREFTPRRTQRCERCPYLGTCGK